MSHNYYPNISTFNFHLRTAKSQADTLLPTLEASKLRLKHHRTALRAKKAIWGPFIISSKKYYTPDLLYDIDADILPMIRATGAQANMLRAEVESIKRDYPEHARDTLVKILEFQGSVVQKWVKVSERSFGKLAVKCRKAIDTRVRETGRRDSGYL